MISKVIHSFLRSTQSNASNQQQVQLSFLKNLNKLVTLFSVIHSLEADKQGFPIPSLPHPKHCQPTRWDDGFALSCWERRTLHSSTLCNRTIFWEDPDGLARPIVIDCYTIWIGSTHATVGLPVVPTDGFCGSAEGLRANKSHLAWKPIWCTFPNPEHTLGLPVFRKGKQTGINSGNPLD